MALLPLAFAVATRSERQKKTLTQRTRAPEKDKRRNDLAAPAFSSPPSSCPSCPSMFLSSSPLPSSGPLVLCVSPCFSSPRSLPSPVASPFLAMCLCLSPSHRTAVPRDHVVRARPTAQRWRWAGEEVASTAARWGGVRSPGTSGAASRRPAAMNRHRFAMKAGASAEGASRCPAPEE